MEDYYKILGVPQYATLDEIKIAIKNIALQRCPDMRVKDKETEEFLKKLSYIYDILSNTSSRKEYDARLLSYYDVINSPQKPPSRGIKKTSWGHIIKNRFAFLLLLIFLLFLVLLAFIKSNTSTSASLHISHQNGDLDETFTEKSPVKHDKVPPPQIQKANLEENLKAEGWEKSEMRDGQMPTCYNFTPKKSSINNYLEVQVGGGTDAVIKIINKETEKCIRYVFINSSSIYKIKNIPQGLYYLKIAYGKDWYSKTENGKCIGKFVNNAMYEKGEDILNYNFQYDDAGYRIPSYSLHLDVISSSPSNTFNSQTISESEFNQ